ncbi:MAG: DNA mismatch repair protein MutS, partial [Rhodothermales bacterium]|nr:DNA mismatch repair protein MutS [Rhodothermales bacterium]
ETVYDLEAAGSLATYADLNPTAPFPDIHGAGAKPLLVASGLTHPLLPSGEAVRNSVTYEATPSITLITGSNMSGKSTFLRAVGTAQVMAMAGGPVEAHAFQTAPFTLHTSMGIHDSLADGISFFYAEVRRLGGIRRDVQKNRGPFLVLIDEIFRGTNNRERLLGSRAFLESLASEDCIGLVATHDLELVSLGEEVGAFENRHFREEVVDGRMVFDYVMHPGPCPTTNALKIMAAEGLPVPE